MFGSYRPECHIDQILMTYKNKKIEFVNVLIENIWIILLIIILQMNKKKTWTEKNWTSNYFIKL